MNAKRICKITLIILTIILSMLFMKNISLADDDNFDFSNFDDQVADSSITTPASTIVGAILGVVRIAGTGVSLIIIAVIGMKYMMAAPNERADFKKASIQYVVGAVIVFGASNILGLLIPVIETVFPS